VTPRVQDLMKLIFDIEMMSTSMVEIGYDGACWRALACDAARGTT
jgi:hypothetical protein